MNFWFFLIFYNGWGKELNFPATMNHVHRVSSLWSHKIESREQLISPQQILSSFMLSPCLLVLEGGIQSCSPRCIVSPLTGSTHFRSSSSNSLESFLKWIACWRIWAEIYTRVFTPANLLCFAHLVALRTGGSTFLYLLLYRKTKFLPGYECDCLKFLSHCIPFLCCWSYKPRAWLMPMSFLHVAVIWS